MIATEENFGEEFSDAQQAISRSLTASVRCQAQKLLTNTRLAVADAMDSSITSMEAKIFTQWPMLDRMQSPLLLRYPCAARTRLLETPVAENTDELVSVIQRFERSRFDTDMDEEMVRLISEFNQRQA